MNAYKDSRRDSTITVKELSNLTQDQIKILSTHTEGTVALKDEILAKIVKECGMWGNPERKFCIDFQQKAKDFPVDKVGRFEESSFGKVYSLKHTEAATIVTTTSADIQFDTSKYPQLLGRHLRGGFEVIANFYIHLFKIEEGEVVVVIKEFDKLAPREFSPYRPSALESIVSVWRQVLHDVCKIVPKKTYDTEAYEKIAIKTLNTCPYADYWALSTQIFDFIVPKTLTFMEKNNKITLFKCDIGTEFGIFKPTDSQKGPAAEAAREFHAQVGSYPKYFKIAPVIKVKFGTKDNVDTKILINAMTDIVARFGGNSSSVMQSIDCESFPGRMSERHRRMVTLCSVIESWHFATKSGPHSNKNLYVYGVDVGMIPILYSTLLSLNVTRVKVDAAPKAHGQLMAMKGMLIQRDDIVSAGHTLYLGGALSTPVKNKEFDVHYEEITKALREYTIYIGQCTSNKFWQYDTATAEGIKAYPRYVYGWYGNVSGVAVSSMIKLETRCDPFAEGKRGALESYASYKDYLGQVYMRIKRSYITIFSAVKPVNFGWATILTAQAKGIQISYTDDMQYALTYATGITDEEEHQPEEEDNVLLEDDQQEEVVTPIVEVEEDELVLAKNKKPLNKTQQILLLRKERTTMMLDIWPKNQGTLVIDVIDQIEADDLTLFRQYLVNLIDAGLFDQIKEAAIVWLNMTPEDRMLKAQQDDATTFGDD